MHEVLNIVGIVCAALAGIGLVASIAMFFGFQIPAIWKDANGVLAQKQIEEIRVKSMDAAKRNKVNVFEELEKKAKVRKNNTQSLNLGPTTSPSTKRHGDSGTVLLKKDGANLYPDFIIEKNVMFVSTDEVI